MGIFNLTESEKKKILNLHNSARIIKEQSTPPTDDKSKIVAIQTALNTKYNSGLKVDGILGQNTLTALSNAMKSITSNAKTPPPAAGTLATGAPAAAAPVSPAAPAAPAAAAAPAAPAAGTPAAGTPTRRDQRRERQDMRRSNRRQMQDLRAQQNTNQ